MEHAVEPFRQVGPLRHLVGDPRVADLGLGPHDPLRQRGRRPQECPGDLLGGEAADLAQGERDPGVRRQGGMAAGEDQAKPVVLDPVGVADRGVLRVSFQPQGQLGDRLVEPCAAAEGVDGLEPAGGDEPGAGTGRHAVPRPALDGRRERVVERLLREIEVAEQPDEGGEDAARVGAVDRVDRVPRLVGGGGVRHPARAYSGGSKFRIGRTSTHPSRADGIFAATWMASFRSRASTR